MIIFLKPMRPDLNLANSIRKDAELKRMPQYFSAARSLIGDIVRPSIRKRSLPRFSPLRLDGTIKAFLPRHEHLRGHVAIGSVHDEAGHILCHGIGRTLDCGLWCWMGDIGLQSPGALQLLVQGSFGHFGILDVLVFTRKGAEREAMYFEVAEKTH